MRRTRVLLIAVSILSLGIRLEAGTLDECKTLVEHLRFRMNAAAQLYRFNYYRPAAEFHEKKRSSYFVEVPPKIAGDLERRKIASLARWAGFYLLVTEDPSAQSRLHAVSFDLASARLQSMGVAHRVRFSSIEKGFPPGLNIEFDHRDAPFAAGLSSTVEALPDLRSKFAPHDLIFRGAMGAAGGGEVGSSPERDDLSYRPPTLYYSWDSIVNLDLSDRVSQHELDHLRTVAMGKEGVESPVYTILHSEGARALMRGLSSTPYSHEVVFDELKVAVGDVIRLRNGERTETNAKYLKMRLLRVFKFSDQFIHTIDYFENHRGSASAMIRNVGDRVWWLSLDWGSGQSRFSSHTPLVGVKKNPGLRSAYEYFWTEMARMKRAAAISREDTMNALRVLIPSHYFDLPFKDANDRLARDSVDDIDYIWHVVSDFDFTKFYEALNIPPKWRP